MRADKVKMGTAWLVGLSCLCILGTVVSAVADQGDLARKIPVALLDGQGSLLSDAGLAYSDTTIAEAKATLQEDGTWLVATAKTETKLTLFIDRPGFDLATAEVQLPAGPNVSLRVHFQEKTPWVEFVTPQAEGQTTAAVMALGAPPMGPSPVALTAGDQVAPAPTRQGGETCASATPIASLPFTATGTTVGYTDDYEEACTYSSTSPDVVYSYTPTANVAVDITLCVGSTDYDTKLFVYEDTCASPYHACNDDACSSPYYSTYVSELLGVAMNTGHTYYIVVDGYGGGSGTYTIDMAAGQPPPDCPDGSLFSQPTMTPSDGWSAGTSEINANGSNYLRAENFSGVVGDICDIHWWGLDVFNTGTAWVDCTDSDPTFEIKFYQDAAGVPGAEVCSYMVTATVTPTGLFYAGFELNYYSVDLLAPCCQLTGGWVSIQGFGDTDCWFLWMSSSVGDGSSYFNNNGVPETYLYDNSLCLTGEYVPHYGACCDDTTGICNDGIEMMNCLPPLRFAENTLCADLDPACGEWEPTGACCDYSTETCYPDKTQADCEGVGWDWLGEGTVCIPNPCLLCADDSATVPGTYSGTTCGAGDDWFDTCLGYYDGGEDFIYALTITDPIDVDIVLDPMGNSWTGVAIDDQCPPGLTCMAYSTSSSSVPHGIDCIHLEPGIYYIMIDSWPSPDCFPFQLSITECVPCVVDCPPGANIEGEPCGSDTNGGCNMVIPTFEPIACGDTVCGTVWADGGTRDTDWYEVVVTQDTEFTWSAEAEFDVVIGLVEVAVPGQPDCASASALNPYAVGGECEPISITTECLPAGTYWFFVSHQTYYDAPCDSNNDYVATLTCVDCVIPLGACCMPDGSCVPDQPEDVCIGLGGDWQGEGTGCDPNPCPQPAENDLCENAIPVGVPSVTPGSTDLATVDSGFPSCGTAGTPSANGVWYSVIGTGNTMTADLCNGATTYDSRLTVYCMGCDDAKCVDGNDDSCGLQSSVTWCSQNGVEYLILVHGYSSNTGSFELTISDDGVPCEGAVCCYCEGACCLPDASCIISCGQDACEAQGGEWQGCDTDCTGFVVPPPCTNPDATVTVVIQTDSWGSETSWELVERGVGVAASGSGYASSTLYTIDVPVCSASCYDFTIYDAYGDGIYAPGGYEILYEGVVVASTLGDGWSGDEETVTDIGGGCAAGGVGACCLDDGSCVVTIAACCEFAGREFLGAGTDCGEASMVVFSEDFEGGIPGDWTVTDDIGSGLMWNSNVYWGDPNWTGCDGDSAEASSDHTGSAPYDTSLITPVLDLSGTSNATLDCMVNFQNFAGYDWFYIDVSYDAGGSWNNLLTWNEDHGTFHGAPGEQVTLAMGSVTATTQVRFRFYDPISHYNWDVQVDCITITVDVEAENPCPQPAALDIKPGSCPNPLNRKSHGVIPVALMSTEQVDVTQVDIATLRISRADGIGGEVAPHEGPPGPHTVFGDAATPFEGEWCGCHDLEGDGIVDVKMKFKTDDVVAGLDLWSAVGTTELVVTGQLLDGTEFFAEDCVHFVPPVSPPGMVTVNSNAAGAWIEVSPMDLRVDGGGFADFTRGYVQGELVFFTAEPTYDVKRFVGWRKGGQFWTTDLSMSMPVVADGHTLDAIFLRPGDIDGDDQVNLSDFATFALCYQGPGATTPPAGCEAESYASSDFDGDGDVDLSDFATFATSYGT